MSLSSWTSLFFEYSFIEAHHASEFEKFFLFSQCSLCGMTLEFGFLSYPKLCLLFQRTRGNSLCVFTLRQINANCLVSVVWKFTMFWLFGGFFLYQSWSLVCLSLPIHTWPIESGVLPCPCQLVLIERVEEKWPSHSYYSAYYYILLILAWHYSRPPAGKPHLLPPQPGECMRVSYFLVIYIYI